MAAKSTRAYFESTFSSRVSMGGLTMPSYCSVTSSPRLVILLLMRCLRRCRRPLTVLALRSGRAA
ncbi:hypothetical protein ACFFX0_05250 [Citricoccus parietis]|uniref:Uncharacterized protein n=1 Tax=Citricoccus parietis TaxID=592307 RepID=A0ABV5FVB3_9MICC